MKNKIEVSIIEGYTGKPKCEAKFGGKTYIIEIEYIELLLRNMIGLKGAEITQSSRQKYPRLTIKGTDKLYKLNIK
jgi:hypothetical protein